MQTTINNCRFWLSMEKKFSLFIIFNSNLINEIFVYLAVECAEFESVMRKAHYRSPSAQ